MSGESDRLDPHSPDFVESPTLDQPDTPPEAMAFDASPATNPQDSPEAADDFASRLETKAEPVSQAKARPQPQTVPKLEMRTGAKPAPAAKSSSTSMISNGIMMVLGAALAAGGYGLARVFDPPTAPGEVSNQTPADMVKKEDLQTLANRIDQMSVDLRTTQKQINDRPDTSAELKMQRERVDALDRQLAELPAQMDSIRQKLDTVSKIEDTNSAASVDTLNQRLTDLAQQVDSLQTAPAGPANQNQAADDLQVDKLAMGKAVEYFQSKKWSDAKGAFTKLQSVFPNDATVWYYSALANGFATGEWLGETERLVNVGLDKEKLGEPSSATIDAVFSGLTPATGQNWLAGYRQRIGAK